MMEILESSLPTLTLQSSCAQRNRRGGSQCPLTRTCALVIAVRCSQQIPSPVGAVVSVMTVSVSVSVLNQHEHHQLGATATARCLFLTQSKVAVPAVGLCHVLPEDGHVLSTCMWGGVSLRSEGGECPCSSARSRSSVVATNVNVLSYPTLPLYGTSLQRCRCAPSFKSIHHLIFSSMESSCAHGVSERALAACPPCTGPNRGLKMTS
jgi:hypothetical protein